MDGCLIQKIHNRWTGSHGEGGGRGSEILRTWERAYIKVFIDKQMHTQKRGNHKLQEKTRKILLSVRMNA